MTKLFGNVYKNTTSSIGTHWVMRLREAGGYIWHGQVAHTSFKNITEEEFKNECIVLFGEISFDIKNEVVDTGTEKKKNQKTYFRFSQSHDGETDKAYKMQLGSSGHLGRQVRDYFIWIPKSQIIKQDDGFMYVASWIVAKNNMWEIVNKEDKIKI